MCLIAKWLALTRWDAHDVLFCEPKRKQTGLRPAHLVVATRRDKGTYLHEISRYLEVVRRRAATRTGRQTSV